MDDTSTSPARSSPAPSPAPAADSRARLLEAAVQAFAEKGFHGTTTRDIATGAGMSPAALYVHHRSKEELLFVISRDGHLVTLDLLRRARAASDDPAVQLRTAVRDFAAHHARGHTRARIVNYELAALSPEHLAEVQDLRRSIDAEVRGIVVDGVASGVFDCPEPRIAAAAVLSLGIDLARWYREGGEWGPEDVGERYAEIALRIVGA